MHDQRTLSAILLICGLFLAVILIGLGFVAGQLSSPLFGDSHPSMDTLPPTVASYQIDFDVARDLEGDNTIWLDDPALEFTPLPALKPDRGPHDLIGKKMHMLNWCLTLPDVYRALYHISQHTLKEFVRTAGNTCLSSVQNRGRLLSGEVQEWIKDVTFYTKSGRRLVLAIYDMGPAFRHRRTYSWVQIEVGEPSIKM